METNLTQEQKDAFVLSTILVSANHVRGINMFTFMKEEERLRVLESLFCLNNFSDEDVISIFVEYMNKVIRSSSQDKDKDELNVIVDLEVDYDIDFYWGVMSQFPEKLLGAEKEVIRVSIVEDTKDEKELREKIILAGLTKKGMFPKSYSVGAIKKVENDK